MDSLQATEPHALVEAFCRVPMLPAQLPALNPNVWPVVGHLNSPKVQHLNCVVVDHSGAAFSGSSLANQ